MATRIGPPPAAPAGLRAVPPAGPRSMAAPSYATAASGVRMAHYASQSRHPQIPPTRNPVNSYRAPPTSYAMSHAPSAVSCMSGVSVSQPVGNHACRVPSNRFEVGMVVNVPHAEMSMDNNLQAGNPSLCQSTIGALSTKMRYMVIVAKFDESHMLALPVYSHGSRGISHLPPKTREQYVGIIKEADEYYSNEAKYLPLELEFGCRWEPRGTSYVHVTKAVSVEYDKRVKSLGYLTEESTTAAVKLYRRLLMAALDSSLDSI